MSLPGVKATNLPLATLADTLIVVRGGNARQMEPGQLSAQLGAINGPTYETRAQLYADLAWAAGSVGKVVGDETLDYRGMYKKSGSSGSGTWARIGPLPEADAEGLASEIAAARLGAPTLADRMTTVNDARIAMQNAGWGVRFQVSSGVSELVAVTPSGVVDWALTIGMRGHVVAPETTETRPITLAVNGGPVVPLVMNGNKAIPAGAWIGGRTYDLRLAGVPEALRWEVVSGLDEPLVVREAAARVAAASPQINLFQMGTEFTGKVITASGVVEDNAAFWSTGHISVTPGQVYRHTPPASGKNYAFYDGGGAFISSVLSTGAFTAPAAAATVRGSSRRIDTPPENYILVVGDTLPSQARGAPMGVAALEGDGKVSARSLRSTRSVNLFDRLTVVEGVYVRDDGVLVANTSFYATAHIEVTAGRRYTWSYAGTPNYAVFYDASKNYISGAQYSGSVIVPSGAAYMRISVRYSLFMPEALMIVDGDVLPASYQPYAGASAEVQINKNRAYGYAGLDKNGHLAPYVLPPGVSPLAGKIIAGLGDSITYGFVPRNDPGYPGQLQSWLPLMAEILGASALNYGISGSTLAYHAGASPMSRRFAAMDDSADLIIVMGGTNDVRQGISLGVMGDTTDTTFFGALDVIARGLLEKYRYNTGAALGAQKKIVFATPIRLLDPAEPDGLHALLPSFCAAVVEVAERYSIPVFDAYNHSGLTPELFRTLEGTETGYTDMYNPLVPDGTHPGPWGQFVLARAFAGFVRGLY